MSAASVLGSNLLVSVQQFSLFAAIKLVVSGSVMMLEDAVAKDGSN